MIIITGASDGLGKELAKLYLDDGKEVVCLSRSHGPEGVRHIALDLLDETSIKKTIEEINRTEEPIEALINAAGVFSEEEIESLTAEEIDRVLDTNVKGPMVLTSGLMDKLKKDGADIVNVASTIGAKAYPKQASYGVSKWALRGFSANLQLELKDSPCRVISFCPGGFKSKLFEKAVGYDNTGDASEWMRAADVALLIKQILSLPKNMEVSEIFVNRKTQS